jgi:hypothetical protein
LIFHVLFLSLDRAQSIFCVLFLLLRLAKPAFGVLLLAFRIIDERTKSILNFEKLALDFGPEIVSGRPSVRLADWGVWAIPGHSERSSRAESTTQCVDDHHDIAPTLARAIIEVVLCPLSSGTKMTFPP